MNMRNYRTALALAALVIVAVSCCDKARIKGVVTEAGDSEVIVKKLSGGSAVVIDTVKTNAQGNYSCNVKVEDGQPQFVYVYKGENKIASLLLSKGDKVSVISDTLGGCSVEGSDESLLLQKVENEFSDFLRKFNYSVESGDQAGASREYVSYYRECVKYVMENSKSLTVIPVLYQKINENFPVFSQSTDAILFRSVHDSLMTVYPDSKYVIALGDEVDRRLNAMNLGIRIQNASESTFPDLDLPSIGGFKLKLSEVRAKVVMVYFWTASDAKQKMYNNDALIPVYNDFHDKGFEIYAVSLDTDKGVWASAVKDQKLPWVNVCDGLGAASPAAALYNVKSLPVLFLIVNGEISEVVVKGENDLRRFLAATL